MWIFCSVMDMKKLVLLSIKKQFKLKKYVIENILTVSYTKVLIELVWHVAVIKGGLVDISHWKICWIVITCIKYFLASLSLFLLTLGGWAMCICVRKLASHWFKLYLVTFLVPSQYCNQHWLIVNLKLFIDKIHYLVPPFYMCNCISFVNQRGFCLRCWFILWWLWGMSQESNIPCGGDCLIPLLTRIITPN